MNKLRAALAVSGALLLIGLLSAPAVHAQTDQRQAKPPPGKALVFVFRRERESVDAPVPVSVNAEAAGQLANGTFLVATVAPGKTFVRSGDRVLSAVAFQAEPNRSYFVRVEAVSGTKPVRTDTRLAPEAEGRKAVAQSQLAAAPPAVVAAPRAAAPAPKPAPPPQAAKPVAPPPAEAKPAPQAAAPAPPPPVTKPAPAPAAAAGKPEEAGGGIALIVKAGSFKLAEADQTVGGTASTFDTTSKPAAGIEIEWRSRSGLALGGEVFYYKNEFVPSAIAATAEQEVYAAMLNGKYYFRAADWFYPYAGAGIGLAAASYRGSLSGEALGLAYQGLAGAEFRFGGVGFHLQFKYLAATTEGKLAGTGTTEKVKVGGSGMLAGVSFIF
jgi:opacity protein-like surface antigen